MNDFKVFVKADPSKELHYLEDEILEIIEKNEDMFMGSNESNLHSSQEIAAMFKPVSLTELMVGFAEWCADSSTRTDAKWWVDENLENPNTTEEMLKFYLKEKGVVL